ncbi:hypothetical protein AALO_G00284290 [Alosa alosa]|uniref:Rhodopsin n=1 Tax=Alosa alosa TaxID=278164 RepID=A0AAV6FN86_9TELE|nr:hypothetical protein AALO_G00284290 [Alosa alosa]
MPGEPPGFHLPGEPPGFYMPGEPPGFRLPGEPPGFYVPEEPPHGSSSDLVLGSPLLLHMIVYFPTRASTHQTSLPTRRPAPGPTHLSSSWAQPAVWVRCRWGSGCHVCSQCQ